MKFIESIEGRVSGVYIGQNPVVSESVPEVVADIGGFAGDRHYGFQKTAGVREKNYDKGTLIRNRRQWSAVSEEELKIIAENMGVPEIKPEWLGANLLLEGIPDLTKLPSLTQLIISDVNLVVYKENLPCIHPGDVIAEQYGNTELASRFLKASIGYRGLVGWIEKQGTIKVGDLVKILLP